MINDKDSVIVWSIVILRITVVAIVVVGFMVMRIIVIVTMTIIVLVNIMFIIVRSKGLIVVHIVHHYHLSVFKTKVNDERLMVGYTQQG